MTITGEMIILFMVIIGALFSVVYFFWQEKKESNTTFNEIRKENITHFTELKDLISGIRENFVKHEVCKERREKCPCVKELEEFKKILKIGDK